MTLVKSSTCLRLPSDVTAREGRVGGDQLNGETERVAAGGQCSDRRREEDKPETLIAQPLAGFPAPLWTFKLGFHFGLRKTHFSPPAQLICTHTQAPSSGRQRHN